MRTKKKTMSCSGHGWKKASAPVASVALHVQEQGPAHADACAACADTEVLSLLAALVKKYT